MTAEQLTFTTLGGDVVSVPTRGKHYVKPRGYAHMPGGGPKGETCGSCAHIVKFRRWHKCEKSRTVWTGGRGSDVLARAPACKHWQAPEQ